MVPELNEAVAHICHLGEPRAVQQDVAALDIPACSGLCRTPQPACPMRCANPMPCGCGMGRALNASGCSCTRSNTAPEQSAAGRARCIVARVTIRTNHTHTCAECRRSAGRPVRRPRPGRCGGRGNATAAAAPAPGRSAAAAGCRPRSTCIVYARTIVILVNVDLPQEPGPKQSPRVSNITVPEAAGSTGTATSAQCPL